MKIKAEVRPIDISKLRLADTLEIELISYAGIKKVIAKVISFVEEDVRCRSCGIILKEIFDWNNAKYCSDCFKRRKEEDSLKKTGRKRNGKEFGGLLIIGKGR